MKLVVFALTPPPHHGQSYMVQLMLDGFGGDHRQLSQAHQQNSHGIQCFHVNARLAKASDDMGQFTPRKLLSLLSYCAQAIYCRFRYGVTSLYYIPALSLKGSVLRDWVVMILCRPFFKNLIFHWHASGLGHWLLEQDCKWLRRITYVTHSRARLSIVLSELNKADAAKFRPHELRVVANGIPDPCPQFDSEVLPARKARLAALASPTNPVTVRVLFLSLCMKEKGLHDAVEAIHIANTAHAQGHTNLRFHLTVAGKFFTPEEEQSFTQLVQNLKLGESVTYAGFLGGDQKKQVLIESDILCFPTYYSAEAQPVVLLEAMAFGLPIVTTRWRSLPELFPPDYPGLVEIKSPSKVAEALRAVLTEPTPARFRKEFLSRFTLEAHLSALAEAIRSVESGKR